MKDNGDDLTASLRGNPLKAETSELTNESQSDVFEYTFPNPPTPRLKPHTLITILIGLSVLMLVLFVVVAFTPYGLTISEGQIALAWHQTHRYYYVYSPNSNLKLVEVDTSKFLWTKVRPILLCLSSLGIALWLKHFNLYPVVVRGFDLRGRTLRIHYLRGRPRVYQIPSWTRARVEHSPYDPQDSPHHDPARYRLEAIGPVYLQIDTTDTYYGVTLGVSMKKSELKALANQINAYLDSQVSPSADQFELPGHRH